MCHFSSFKLKSNILQLASQLKRQYFCAVSIQNPISPCPIGYYLFTLDIKEMGLLYRSAMLVFYSKHLPRFYIEAYIDCNIVPSFLRVHYGYPSHGSGLYV